MTDCCGLTAILLLFSALVGNFHCSLKGGGMGSFDTCVEILFSGEFQSLYFAQMRAIYHVMCFRLSKITPGAFTTLSCTATCMHFGKKHAFQCSRLCPHLKKKFLNLVVFVIHLFVHVRLVLRNTRLIAHVSTAHVFLGKAT